MSLLPELVEYFGLSRSDLNRIIATAPARYKVYEIPKRRGGKRTIAQPSRELKAIQRFVLEQKLSVFPVHAAAMGYVSGRGILSNARQHQRGQALLKLDFENFFPSIKVRDWILLCKSSNFDAIHLEDLPLYSKILFWGAKKKSIKPQCLSIGAPTSPALSNILMFALDNTLAATAADVGVVYTRYADDITISGPDIDQVRNFESAARKIIRAAKSPKLKFNEEKRGLFQSGDRRMVTGLVITPTKQISIGRARKREISALIHRSSLGQLDAKRRGYLKGILGFSLANEPEFVERMRAKYGNEAVDAALAYHVPKREIGIDE